MKSSDARLPEAVALIDRIFGNQAQDVTVRRMYLETMENVLGRMNKVILDGVSGEAGAGVVAVTRGLDEASLATAREHGAAIVRCDQDDATEFLLRLAGWEQRWDRDRRRRVPREVGGW